MPLSKIPSDPSPTEDEVAFMMAEKEVHRLPSHMRRSWVEFRWKIRERAAHPDLFLVPFPNWIRSFPDGSQDYNSYRMGKLWKKIRASVLELSGCRCECCGRKASDVHHRDYRPKVLSGDDPGPLVSICRSCHDFVHVDPTSSKRRGCWQDEEKALANIYRHGYLYPAPSLRPKPAPNHGPNTGST